MFYVYEYYIKETNEVFYVGKGTGNRYKELHNRNKYFKRVYDKYECDVRIIKDNLTNEQACELEIQKIAELKPKCNFTNGGDGFSTGDLNPNRINPPIGDKNPMYGIRNFGEDNHFYGKKHSDETKRKISESRKGKGGMVGKDNPMYGKGFKGEDNPMYGQTGLKHPNSKGYKITYLDGNTEILHSSACEKKFGIAFVRIRKTGGILDYKKKSPNDIYQGVKVELL